MMTDPRRQHARYDELAAGYALDTLDGPDEADFAAHLPGCSRCQDAVARFTEITAALAGTAPPAEPSPDLGLRIMAAAASEPARAEHGAPAGSDGPAGQDAPADHGAPAGHGAPADSGAPARQAVPAIGSHRPHRPRRPLRTAAATAAAAAALIAGGATYAAVQDPGPAAQPPAAGCVQARTCREIVLTAASTRAPAARLIVADGTAWLVPSGLRADNTAQQVYVLWQITGGHTPLAVGSFDVRGHHGAGRPIRVGPLTVPYSGTWAFAVSLEHGRTIPSAPSHPVALAQVPS
jgi:anti-sigma-K factor RskA